MSQKYSEEYLQAAAKFALGDLEDKITLGIRYSKLVSIVSRMSGKAPDQTHFIIQKMSEGDFSYV